MRQNRKTKLTKLKTIILLTIITITTSCATNNRHKRLALKIIKNNNVILKQIKVERNAEPVRSEIKKSNVILRAEKRLLMALNTIIKANNSLKKEFKKKTIRR